MSSNEGLLRALQLKPGDYVASLIDTVCPGLTVGRSYELIAPPRPVYRIRINGKTFGITISEKPRNLIIPKGSLVNVLFPITDNHGVEQDPAFFLFDF